MFCAHHAAIIATWLWSALWSAVPLFFDYYDLEGVGTSCGVIANHVDRRSKSYLICYFAFCFALPLFIMSVAYALILSKIWKVNIHCFRAILSGTIVFGI